MNPLEQLIHTLSRIPGIGHKSAARIAHYLLKTDRRFTDQLSQQIGELRDRIRQCSVCGNYTETDPCDLCNDLTRDRSCVCVVEQPEDIAVIEGTHEIHGLFHVLGGVISPLDGIGPDRLIIDALVKRVEKEGIRELILAMNPTVQGDTTALYLASLVRERGIVLTRLASGIPVGGDLGYADRLTLARSLRGRIPY